MTCNGRMLGTEIELEGKPKLEMKIDGTADIKQVQERVTNYVAERIVERQRAVDGELEPLRAGAAAESAYAANSDAVYGRMGLKDEWSDFSAGIVWFAAGALTGAALIFLWLWDRIPGIVGGSVWR